MHVNLDWAACASTVLALLDPEVRRACGAWRSGAGTRRESPASAPSAVPRVLGAGPLCEAPYST